MARLEWSKFLRLAGDPRSNWELLCREVIRRHYERFGPLRTRKQQPGVEFHLTVERDGCELGEVGRHWGWQCRWYDHSDFEAKGPLRSNQREGVEKALQKTADHVPSLTDWVLWTKEKLTADDARWFEALDTPFALHHWDEETLIGLLSGPAQMLRETWFGELVLDRTILTERRREALAPIEQRYVEELHLRTPAELETEDLLVGDYLDGQLQSLAQNVDELNEGVFLFAKLAQNDGRDDDLPRQAQQQLVALSNRLRDLQEMLESQRLPTFEEVESVDERGEMDELEAMIARCAQEGAHHVAAVETLPEFENGLQPIRNTLARLAKRLKEPMRVVVGPAGSGKTHLAASLTGPDEEARGVLVLGGQFGAQIEDDDVARFAGMGATREEMLEALDALGMREGRRVPLVIDGLNESQDPSAWHIALPRLRRALRRFRHVFVVATVRPSYRRLALPPELSTMELSGLSGLEEEAVERYFDYYKIAAPVHAIDWWRPSDPLLLSIFCRTVNPERKQRVWANDLPSSLTEVFGAYLESVCLRIAKTMKIPAEDIEASILRLADQFFLERATHLDPEVASKELGDSRREKWSESLRFQLETEELLIRDILEDREWIAWNYDLLAGHMLAKSLLRRYAPDELADLKVSTVLEEHPLCEDILTGLAGILGSRSQDLTRIFEPLPALAAQAALASLRLPASQVREATTAALGRLFVERPNEVLETVTEAMLRRRDPLKPDLLDGFLGELEVWRRDLVWTDWMQERMATHEQVCRLSEQWRLGDWLDDDEASIGWLSWVLTATDKPLRDAAIQALYRVGKKKPEALFARTLQMLGANDPSVAEGLLAASYGVVMSSQDPASGTLDATLGLAVELRSRLLEERASQPTSHWLIREYAYRTAQLAAWISEGDFSAPAKSAQPPLPQPKGKAPICKPGDRNWFETEGAPGLDAAEKTLRGLPTWESPSAALERRWEEIFGEMRARMVELGWNRDRFRSPRPAPIVPRPEGEEEEEERVSFEEANLRREREFGEKYSSIAFYEAIGRLSDRSELNTLGTWRLRHLPIDPSFPESASLAHLDLRSWIDSKASDEFWVFGKEKGVPSRLIYQPHLPQDVPWVAVNGFLWQERGGSSRRATCAIRGFLVLGGWPPAEELLRGKPDLLPDNPVDADCFAGEVPWSPTFDTNATQADGSFHPRVDHLEGYADEGPAIELLGVDVKWDDSRSPLNRAEIGSMPSKAFAHHAGLRKVADRLEFVDLEGRPAAVSVSPRGIDGWYGTILYVREDLLRSYCSDREGEWGWMISGERQLFSPDQEQIDLTTPEALDGFSTAISLEEVAARHARP